MIEKYLKKQKRLKIYFLMTLIFLFFFSVIYLKFGIIRVSLKELFIILSSSIFSPDTLDLIESSKTIAIITLRLPRLVSAILIGGSLSVAGLFLQGLFKNPLVDPYVTGISAGATLGATIAILLGIGASFIGLGGIIIFAFIGSFITLLLIFIFINIDNKRSSSTLLLIGISISLFFSSIVYLLMFFNKDKIDSIVIWTMGSISDPGWNKILLLIPVIIVSLTGLYFTTRAIDLISLDEELAKTHGINVFRTKVFIIFFSSLITASCVSISGIIGFIGLIIPNIIRKIFGTRHRVLLPFSFISGAILLLFSDLLARTIFAPAEIPVGIVTSLIGVPFFLFLIYKNKRNY